MGGSSSAFHLGLAKSLARLHEMKSKEPHSTSVVDVVNIDILPSNKSIFTHRDPQGVSLKCKPSPFGETLLVGRHPHYGRALPAVSPSDGRLVVTDCRVELLWKTHRVRQLESSPESTVATRTCQRPASRHQTAAHLFLSFLFFF